MPNGRTNGATGGRLEDAGGNEGGNKAEEETYGIETVNCIKGRSSESEVRVRGENERMIGLH